MNFPDQEQRIIELDKTGDATLNEVCVIFWYGFAFNFGSLNYNEHVTR